VGSKDIKAAQWYKINIFKIFDEEISVISASTQILVQIILLLFWVVKELCFIYGLGIADTLPELVLFVCTIVVLNDVQPNRLRL
jgi:hypothetical protein